MHWEHNRRQYWESHLIERGEYPSQGISTLEKLWHASPYVAVGLTGAATFLSRGMAPGAPLKKRKRSIKNLRGVKKKLTMGDEAVEMRDSSGRSAPTAAPTVAVEPSRVYVTNIGDLGKRKVSVVVGNRDAIPEECAINFNVKGWRINRRDWRYSRLNYSPAEVVIGNLLTTVAGDGVPPSWVTGVSTGAQSDDGNYFSGVVTCQKAGAVARAALYVKGSGSDTYADFCIPVVPVNSYGPLDLGVVTTQQTPFGLLDMFKQFQNGTTTDGNIYDISLHQYAAQPYGASINSFLNHKPDLGPMADDTIQDSTIMRGFLKVLTEFVIVNNSLETMHYEIMQVLPKAVHRTSPLSDLIFSYTGKMQENETFNTDGYSFVRLDKDPEEYMHWKKKWRYHRRRVVCAPGQVVRVRMYTPLSQISRDTCLGLLGSETSTVSVPGITQWLWVRAHGITGFDNSAHKIGVGQGQFAISMHQKITAWYSKPKINKMINLVDKPFTEVITPDERQAVDDNTAA